MCLDDFRAMSALEVNKYGHYSDFGGLQRMSINNELLAWGARGREFESRYADHTHKGLAG